MATRPEQRGFRFARNVLRVTSWLASLWPEAPGKSVPGFDPEVDPLPFPETCEKAGDGLPGSCRKAASNHPLYIPFNDLDLQHLPAGWRHQHVLQQIRDIGQRVVKLRVRKLSPDRPVEDPKLLKYGHQGTGFVTYDRDLRAPVVNTNRHVVYDPYEASQTEVIFFYEGDNEGIQCAGSSDGFKSTFTMDYSSFTLKQPLPEVVVTWQNRPMSNYGSDDQGFATDAAASKANELDTVFSLSTIDVTWLSLVSDDVVIISHPHGSRKQVSVGKLMSRIGCMNTETVYTAPTCPASSGAPLLRLCDRDSLDVCAGQVLHQGDFTTPDQNVSRGVGLERPLVTRPYDQLTDVGRLRRWTGTLTSKVQRFQDAIDWNQAGCLAQCINTLCNCFFGNVIFFIVGPPWTLTGIICLLLFVISHRGNVDVLRFTVYVCAVSMAAMHGVKEWAGADDWGWLWTALLVMAYTAIHLFALCLWFLAFLLILPNLIVRAEDRLMTWAAKTLSRGQFNFWRPFRKFRHKQGFLAQNLCGVVPFLVFYVWFCVVGPPWTLAGFISLLCLFIYGLPEFNAGHLRVLVLFALLFTSLHVVTELACVLVPPEDRGWLWTGLLWLSCFIVHRVIYYV